MINGYNESAIPQIIDYLKHCGINNNGIAGLLGNLYAESKMFPNNMQNSYENKPPYYWNDDKYVAAVDNGSYKDFCTDKIGMGICQWTSVGRKTGLYEYVKSKNKSIADLQCQLDWLYVELSVKYKTVLAELCSTNNTVKSCAEIVVCKFEVPASVLNESTKQATINVRAGYAQEFYDKYLAEKSNLAFSIPQIYLTNNDCYKDNWRMKPQGIIVHSTGVNNPSIKRYVQPDDGIIGVNTNNNDWNRPGIEKCVSAFIGKDKNGNVTGRQTLPWDMCTWGCGRGSKGSYNYPATKSHTNDIPYIQFEICEDNLCDQDYFNKVFDYAAELCAYLCKVFNIPIINVKSHQEAAKEGMASNHSDPNHWLSKYGKDMNWFRNLVSSKMKVEVKPVEPEKPEPSPIPDNKEEIKTYTIIRFDTLYKIAKRTNTTVDYLLALNPEITDPKKLQVGQVIKISGEPIKETEVKVDYAKSYDKSLSRTYTATTNLNVRNGAGITKDRIVLINKGTQVRCYGYYTTVLGVKWLLVQFTYNNKKYTGFCSSTYLK